MSVTPHVQIVDEIDSTNAALMRALVERDCHGEVLMARQQTAGRGQRGRRWQSNAGDALMFSIAWRFDTTQSLEGLSLAVGTLVAESVSPLLYASGHQLTLKWPNDILVDSHYKLAGILIEIASSARASRAERTAIIGIGINLKTPVIDDSALALPPIGLNHYLSQPQTPEAILSVILPRLTAGLELFAEKGFADFQERWWALRSFAEQDVHVHLPKGEPINGRIHAVTPQGALVVRSNAEPAKLHTLVSGEVRVRAVGA